MKRVARLAFGLFVVFWGIWGSGCASQSLKDANQRLKESNDRLISENNRLEEEVAALQKKLMDADRNPPPSAPVVALNPAPGPAKPDLAAELLIDPEVDVARTPTGLRIRVPDRVFFGLGQAKLTSQGTRILDKIAKLVRERYPNKVVRVDGHTDDTPIRKVRNVYPTNWELSTARACTVVRYLIETGDVNPNKIYPAGFSSLRPISSNRSPTGKSQNRRVEIMILEESV